MIIAFPSAASAGSKARTAIQTLRDSVARVDPTRHMSHAAQGLAAALKRVLELASLLETRVTHLEQSRADEQAPSSGANLTEIISIASTCSDQVTSAEDWLSSRVSGPMPAVLQRDYYANLRAQICPAA
jgi:hypothetical protein